MNPLIAGSMGLDLLGGLMGYEAGQVAQHLANSRGDLLRMEGEAEAQRYQEKITSLVGQQKAAYGREGVALTGSPLSVIDESIRIGHENVDAIRMRGMVAEQDARNQGAMYAMQGRQALLGGGMSAFKTFALSKSKGGGGGGSSMDSGGASDAQWSESFAGD